jgi:hypothetical protein
MRVVELALQPLRARDLRQCLREERSFAL